MFLHWNTAWQPKSKKKDPNAPTLLPEESKSSKHMMETKANFPNYFFSDVFYVTCMSLCILCTYIVYILCILCMHTIVPWHVTIPLAPGHILESKEADRTDQGQRAFKLIELIEESAIMFHGVSARNWAMLDPQLVICMWVSMWLCTNAVP